MFQNPQIEESLSDPSLAEALTQVAEALSALGQGPGETPVPVQAEGGGSFFANLGNWDVWTRLVVEGKDRVIEFIPNAVGAMALFVVGWLVTKVVIRMLRKLLVRSNVDVTLINFFASTAYFGLMAFVCVSAIGQLGVNTGSFVAILGAATFAIGFALQGSLANFAAGVLMILFRPIRIGDFVQVAGVKGTVEDVGVFQTTLKDANHKRVIVSNGTVMSDTITNYTVNGRLRIDMVFGIGYGDDVQLAIQLINKVLAENDKVLSDPAPVVAVMEHGASSVNLACRPFANPSHYWDVIFDTHCRVKEEFDANGISIPYPQRDVHMLSG